MLHRFNRNKRIDDKGRLLHWDFISDDIEHEKILRKLKKYHLVDVNKKSFEGSKANEMHYEFASWLLENTEGKIYGSSYKIYFEIKSEAMLAKFRWA